MAVNMIRNIRQMPYQHRSEGFCPLERMREQRLWKLIVASLTAIVGLPAAVQLAILPAIVALIAAVKGARRRAWNAVDPVNPANRNRGIGSFTEAECWRDLRFRKADLPELMGLLQFPAIIELDNRTVVNGEYAFVLMLYRLHYPSTLAMLQNPFGREYSQLSRIFNSTITLMHDLHSAKILNNTAWYRSRFNMYNYAIRKKIATSAANQFPGLVPVELRDIFGFLDGTHREICRPYGNNNAQFYFYNGYFREHVIMYLGLSFPDGMLVLDPPQPGYFTDTMQWRDSIMQNELEAIMVERAQLNMPRLKVYADKIFNSGSLITAAYSLRHGPVSPWMTTLNAIMSPIRVAIEWVYGRVANLFKFTSFRQKLFESPVARTYHMTALLSNCRTCLYGCQENLHFDILPPTLRAYLTQ